MRAFLTLIAIMTSSLALAQTDGTPETQTKIDSALAAHDVRISKIESRQRQLETAMHAASQAATDSLTSINERYKAKTETLTSGLASAQDAQTELSEKVDSQAQELESSRTTVSNISVIGIIAAIVIALAIIITTVLLRKKISKGDDALASLSKAQNTIQEAQVKMQEEIVKLDSQMIQTVESLMKQQSTKGSGGEENHALALKVADEITRIELNMAHMDPSVKGYKQLAKAVERIKDNFKANGYEIVDILGKPYDEGMKVVASFVSDDSIEEGKQIITGITKPQVNYNGKMIQSAQITVSQNS